MAVEKVYPGGGQEQLVRQARGLCQQLVEATVVKQSHQVLLGVSLPTSPNPCQALAHGVLLAILDGVGQVPVQLLGRLQAIAPIQQMAHGQERRSSA